MFVLIAALVLVAGTAIPAVQAENDTTDITVTVEDEDPEITITSDHDDSIVYDGSQEVTFEIETGSEDEVVDTVHIYLDYDDEDGDVGEAEDEYESDEIYESDNWDGSGTYTDTYTFDSEIDFARAGEWTITAIVNEDEDDEDEDTEDFTVDTYQNIVSVPDLSDNGKPGEDISDSGDVEITSNDDWTLDLDTTDVTVTHENNGESFDVDVEYGDGPGTITGDPLDNSVAGQVELGGSIPYGQSAGTYEGDVGHTLSTN